MPFGQVIIGAPGAGKTVYTAGMQQFMTALGRKVVAVNLDPANDATLPYECAINIQSVIKVDDIMEKAELGPNGGFIFAMEFLEKNLEQWLKKELDKYKDDHYFLFDCPGQLELYTHHKSFRNIVIQLQKWNYRITAVNLVDSSVCTQPATYISALLLSLITMIQLELPHINILSKVDLLKSYGKLAFNLDFYTEVLDLSYLQQYLDEDRFGQKFKKLNHALCELIEDFRLVSFLPLNVQDKESMYAVLKAIDKSNGFVFGGLSEANDSIFSVAEKDLRWEMLDDIQEKDVDLVDVDDSENQMEMVVQEKNTENFSTRT